MAVAAATFLLLLTLFTTSHSATIYNGSIAPNFTTTNFLLIDQFGVFLRSINGTYTAAVITSQPTSPSYYLLITHSASNTIVWVANRNTPISNLGEVRLTTTGITIHDDSGVPVWSTPEIQSTVSSLHLLDSGNLILLDNFNKTLWQSFDHPMDTIVSGQRFPIGGSLTAIKSPADFAEGEYTFNLTSSDGILRWKNLTYYRLLMDPKAVTNLNHPVSSLMVNGSGFYLFGSLESDVVIRVLITQATTDSVYRILKMSNDGRLVVLRYQINGELVTDFSTPADGCRLPSQCGKLQICSAGGCSCPPGFRTGPNSGCLLPENSLSLPESCGGDKRQSNSSENYIYVPLGAGMKYYPVDFIDPVRNGVVLSTCKALCSASCSCLALFYGNQSGSCHLIENQLGSITLTSNNLTDDKLGFIKAISSPISSQNQENGSNSDFPVVGLILLPAIGVLVVFGFAFWVIKRRTKKKKMKGNSKKSDDNSNLDDLDMFTRAVRFDHEDLVEATMNFSTPIGSGEYGTVYKGILRDKTVVAVKKITALGAQGKKEFGTEMTIIGNINHVNLVKLKGFCAHGRDRFLVYEYMSRGSLNRTLLCHGPLMEWQERVEIAIGTARGLAYLHKEHKIIHCDVKPESILLSDNMQVKISNFRLSGLPSPEQSDLFTTRGTHGYLAPEWFTNAAISDRSDVYSYGMVLLELIQGCVRVASIFFPLQALEMHVEGRYLDLVEPRLAGRVTSDEVEKLVKVALCCLHEDPALRPKMANVVAMLEGTLAVGEPRLESLNFLRFYGRRFTEP